jgi:hypothetical protein
MFSVKLAYKTGSFGKNESPIYLWYDTDLIENDASNNLFLPRERVYRGVA